MNCLPPVPAACCRIERECWRIITLIALDLMGCRNDKRRGIGGHCRLGLACDGASIGSRGSRRGNRAAGEDRVRELNEDRVAPADLIADNVERVWQNADTVSSSPAHSIGAPGSALARSALPPKWVRSLDPSGLENLLRRARMHSVCRPTPVQNAGSPRRLIDLVTQSPLSCARRWIHRNIIHGQSDSDRGSPWFDVARLYSLALVRSLRASERVRKTRCSDSGATRLF